MKAFFEEYGFIVLAAVVVVLLISLASPVGQAIKDSVMGLVGKFANTTGSLAETMANSINATNNTLAH